MTEILYFVIAILLIIIIVLLAKLHIMRKTFKEIDEGLIQKLDIDTNTSVTISGLGRYERKLASDLNTQIKRLKKEQRKYKNKNDEIKTAVTNIAHDIRTPLTAIYGYLELFEKANLSPQERKWLEIIKERTDNLKSLAEELFSYSLAYSETEILKKEEIVLNDELAAVLAGFYGALKAENIEPVIEITDKPIHKMLDKKAFGRIIGNLITNSIKYSSGDLFIRLDDEGKIMIGNKTEEMTATDVGRLFERFYTVKTAKGSTGLGLSIARMLTEKMNGTIEAKLDNNNLAIIVFFEDE